jgi:hypothetical protein
MTPAAIALAVHITAGIKPYLAGIKHDIWINHFITHRLLQSPAVNSSFLLRLEAQVRKPLPLCATLSSFAAARAADFDATHGRDHRSIDFVGLTSIRATIASNYFFLPERAFFSFIIVKN